MSPRQSNTRVAALPSALNREIFDDHPHSDGTKSGAF